MNAPRYFLSQKPRSLHHTTADGPVALLGSGSQVSSSSAACAGLKPASASGRLRPSTSSLCRALFALCLVVQVNGDETVSPCSCHQVQPWTKPRSSRRRCRAQDQLKRLKCKPEPQELRGDGFSRLEFSILACRAKAVSSGWGT